MTRLTSKIALGFVLRIEALNDKIEDVYAEVRDFEGTNNDSVIEQAVEERKKQREAAGNADGLISSFDWNEDGERYDPAPEPAWIAVGAKLREVVGDNPKLMKLVGQIDRLQQLAIEKGLPVVSAAELEAAMEQAHAD